MNILKMLLKCYITIILVLFIVGDTLSLKNTEIQQLRDTFYRLDDHLWNYFTKKVTTEKLSYLELEEYLFMRIQIFSAEIEKVQRKLCGTDVFKILPSIPKITYYINKIIVIFNLFNSSQYYSIRNKRAICDLLEKKDKIHILVGQLGETASANYFEKIQKETETFHCVLDQSQQQILYNLYNTIAITELKGHTMMVYQDIWSKLNNKEKNATTREGIKKMYKSANAQLDKSVLKVLKNSSPELWKCDPKSHKENETYIQITELLQGFLINEKDLHQQGKCNQECSIYKNSRRAMCSTDALCKNQRSCKGKILNCKKIESKFNMCIGNNTRIEYVIFESKRKFGKNRDCQKGKIFAQSWKRFNWDNWFSTCAICFCLCDEEGPKSDRFINLRPTFSNINSNRVVTGVRFIKHNRIIHLQIQEGKLLPLGKIDKATVQWLPVDNYDIFNASIKDGIDYHTFTNELRDIDLDTLKLNKNHVVTGVGFQVLRTHINFKIHATPFNYKSGKLITKSSKKSIWTHNNVQNRKKLLLINPDVPIRIFKQTKPDKTKNSFVQLRESDMDKDASQTTVPFFDAQPVASSVPVPLSGVGIYLKKTTNSGGYIAPKIITYDYRQQILP